VSKEILTTQFDHLWTLVASCLDSLIYQEESEIAPFVQMRLRLDQIFTQALTALVTSFAANFNRRFNDSLYLEQLSEIGYLASFESLLRSVQHFSVLFLFFLFFL